MNFSSSQGLGFGKTGKFTYMHFFVFFLIFTYSKI
jgi:hypothetical protein